MLTSDASLLMVLDAEQAEGYELTDTQREALVEVVTLYVHVATRFRADGHQADEDTGRAVWAVVTSTHPRTVEFPQEAVNELARRTPPISTRPPEPSIWARTATPPS